MNMWLSKKALRSSALYRALENNLKKEHQMWKKVLWVYVWLYVLVMSGGIVYNAIVDIQNNNFQLVALIFPLLMFLPAWVVARGLQGKKVFILFTLLSLLLVAIPVAGIFNFNDMSLLTIGKALLFAPMIVGLIWVGFKKQQ